MSNNPGSLGPSTTRHLLRHLACDYLDDRTRRRGSRLSTSRLETHVQGQKDVHLKDFFDWREDNHEFRRCDAG